VKIEPEGGKLKNFIMLEAVSRERAMKTQKAGNGLAGAVVICKVWS
jgi:hypothetical protein